MSVCQSGQPDDDSGSEEVTASAAAVRDFYKQKPATKVVRVLTVLAYLLSVSLAAILLSVYYVCVWKSPELPPRNDTELSAQRQRADHRHYSPSAVASDSHYFTGGGDSGVNQTAFNFTTALDSAAETTDPTAEDSTTDSTLLFYSPNSTYDNTTATDIT